MKRVPIVSAYWLFFVLLAGCAALQPPQTFNDKVGYALVTHTAVLDSAARALEFNEITADEAENVANLADDARALIDASIVAYRAGNESDANVNITRALNLLRQLQNQLRRTG